MMNSKNRNLIRYLEELNEDACVLVFTRHDAEAMAERRIEDDQWKDIVDRYEDYYPSDHEWNNFWHVVKEVIGDSDEHH